MDENIKSSCVLVVDDDLSVTKALATKLRLSGYTVEVAHDGVDGLEMAKRLHPDLIILDILMPRMDGLTMLGQLRMDSWGRYAPVVILTSVDSDDKALEALQNSVYDFLVKKDSTMEEIIGIVDEKLGR